jgi:hypothetical protein
MPHFTAISAKQGFVNVFGSKHPGGEWILAQARPWACATGAAGQGLQMQRASNLNSNNSASA